MLGTDDLGTGTFGSDEPGTDELETDGLGTKGLGMCALGADPLETDSPAGLSTADAIFVALLAAGRFGAGRSKSRHTSAITDCRTGR